MRIKICGLRSVEQALAAVDAGADAIGLNFYPASPRYVDTWTARKICAALPPFVTSVGVFVNPDPADVDRTIAQTGIDLLQFHGDEQEPDCDCFERPYMKAVQVRGTLDIDELRSRYPHARGLLLDAWHEELHGGTGEMFDWSLLHQQGQGSVPIVLAGGLNPGNVRTAITVARPYAVDVSSGVEHSPGVKDSAKMRAFVSAVRQAPAAAGDGNPL